MIIGKTSRRFAATSLLAATFVLSAAWAQPPATSAKVNTSPLQLISPDRYLIPTTLEPVRRVTIVATADGIIRSQDAKEGDLVREGQEVAQLDRVEAAARLKIAQAVVKELQAAFEETKVLSSASKLVLTQAQARLEAAQARVELAQLDLDRCTLRAPFAGRVIDSRFSDGQYVDKGAAIAEIVDVSSLKAFVPVARTGASMGASLPLSVEGVSVTGKIQALVPLPESLSVLRELSTPMVAAWVVVPNGSATLEQGQRVVSPVLPTLPIATIPSQALKTDSKDATSSTVQVLRNEYVTNVKVRAVGNPVPDRVQVTGALRPTDALIVSTSVPLIAGTLIRFSGSSSGRSELTTSDSGESADITPPRGDAKRASSKTKVSSKPTGNSGSASPPSTKGDTKTVPF